MCNFPFVRSVIVREICILLLGVDVASMAFSEFFVSYTFDVFDVSVDSHARSTRGC